jgi:acyl-CoA synthetase (AMP-forming)/AMP-acid ligase II
LEVNNQPTEPTEEFPPAGITMSALLKSSAQRCGDTPFLIDREGGTLSRVELDRQASQFANAVLALGLPPGSAVGIYSPNSFHFVAACFGIFRSGYTMTPFNSSYRRRELLHQIRDSNAAAVFVDPRLLTTIQECVGKTPGLRIIELSPKFWSSAESSDPEIEVDADKHVAFLPYSSGTTGLSKGVELSHANLIAGIRQLRLGSVAGIDSEARTYCFLPMYHIYGFNVIMNTTLASGGCLHFRERFEIEDCLDTVEREKITWLPVVPPIILALLARPDLKERQLQSLNVISVGAAPVAVSTAHRLAEATGVPVRQGYGLTETAGTATTNPADSPWDTVETAGTPVAGMEFKIVDPETGRELAGSETGELAMRGPNVMLGYHNAPEENEKVLRDGWFHTGDIATIDELGRVHIVDRRREMIKYKGFQVTPAELESVMLEMVEIRDCAVVGKKDPVAVEIPKAFVVKRDGAALTKQQVMDYVAEQVAGYKKIRELEFVESIPRSPAGKILRKVLLESSSS